MASRHTWECHNCNGINGERDVTCDVCGQHRKDDRRNQPRKSSCSAGRGGSGLKYDWDSVSPTSRSKVEPDAPSQGRRGPSDRNDDRTGSQWKCTACTYYNIARSSKCKMCHRWAQPREQQTCPPGPARADRSRYPPSKRSPSPPVREDVTSSYDRKRDQPSPRDSGYDRHRGPENGRPKTSPSPPVRKDYDRKRDQPSPRDSGYDRHRGPENGRAKRSPSPPLVRKDYDRKRDQPSPRDSGYDRHRGPENDRPRRSPSPPPDRKDYDRKRDQPSPRDSGYDRHRGPENGRRSPAGASRRNAPRPVWDDCVDRKERRLVLLGKTGCGKSATGNSILSRDCFRSKVSGASITKSCRRGVVQRNGKEIHVVDTPGVFDTEVDNATTTEEIIKCIGITAPGPHAFLLVVRIGRFTAEERDSVEHFIEHFGKSVEKYMIVVFTGMDDLQDEHMSLDDHLKRIPSSLASILNQCGGRCIGFNNKGTAREVSRQVDELMALVEDLFEVNHGRYYTNDMYMEAENVIRMKEAEIRSMAEEEKRRDMREFEDENDRYYKQQLREHEKQQHELERKLKEAESSKGKHDRDRRTRTDEIDKDIKSLRSQMDQERRAGRKVSTRLQDKLSDLERERDRIVKMEGTVTKMQTDMNAMRGQLDGIKKKVSNTKRDQKDQKERRLKELEKKYATSEKSSREEVRKQVENGEVNFGEQVLNAVMGIGKVIWKGLTKLF